MPSRPALDDRTVVIGLCEEPDVLVQDFSLRHVSWAVLAPLMLKLVRYDDAWRPWPELAIRIPDRENGGWRTLADGRTEIEWELRRDVHWHDGTPVTAHDAVFTYELLRRTPPPYPHHTIIEAISEMIVPAGRDHTLIVRWRADEPFAMYEEWGTLLPRHLLAEEGLEDPELRDVHPFLRSPVLDGPYRFSNWTPGSEIVLERSGSHPRGLPSVQRLVFRFFPGPGELATAVIDGTVDVTDLTGFSPADAERIERDASDVRIIETPSFSWEHIDCNLEDEVLGDLRVRRALAHALDRREILERLYRGRYEPADSWLPPRHPAYNPHIHRYAHDPVRAAALLDEAGYRLGADGLRHGRDGRPLTLSLVTTRRPAPGGLWTSSATRPEMAEIVAQQFRRVGVTLEVELVDAGELFPRLRRRRFKQLAMFAWSMSLETTGYLLWHSAKVPDDEDWYGLNVSGWRNPSNDRLLDGITEAGDSEERYDLMRRQQRDWSLELPALPLFFPASINTAKAGLANIRPAGVFGTYVTWNVWEWGWQAEPATRPSRDLSTSSAGAR